MLSVSTEKTDPVEQKPHEIYSHLTTFNLIIVGVCDVASLYSYSHRTFRPSLLAEQFHLQEALRAGPHTPEDGTEIPSSPRDETRRGIIFLIQ